MRLRVVDGEGERLAELEGEEGAGLQTVRWNLRRRAQQRGGRQRGGFGTGARVEPGTYAVELWVGQERVGATQLEVLPDPSERAPASF